MRLAEARLRLSPSDFANLTSGVVLRQDPPPFQHILALDPYDRAALSPWEEAIGRVRAEIRELIEQGEIGWDQMTDGWIAEWAAELLDPSGGRGI